MKQELCYQETPSSNIYELDDDLRQLSFYSIKDKGVIFIHNK